MGLHCRRPGGRLYGAQTIPDTGCRARRSYGRTPRLGPEKRDGRRKPTGQMDPGRDPGISKAPTLQGSGPAGTRSPRRS